MPAKHELMRSTNTLLVLDHIRQHGESTRRSIQHATELSWATVSNISADLIERNILREISPQTRAAGRNPGSLDFVPMRNLTIGLELNAEGLTVLLLDLRCRTVDSLNETLRSMERDKVIAQLLRAVDGLLARNRLTCADMLGMSIATQGSVDSAGTTSLYNSFFLDWRNVPLKEICEEHFHFPVHIMHDPVCIALAEQWTRKFTAEDDFALIRLSFGIGMSYISQGQPINGYKGFAGELGHIVVNPRGPVCSCGNRGCLECYSSIRGLAHRITQLHCDGAIELPEELRAIDDRDIEGMKHLLSWSAQGARGGSEPLRQLFRETGYYLGIGMANIVSLFNPKYIVLIGELLALKDLFWDTAVQTATELAWSFSQFTILLSESGREQAAMGAALYYINDAFGSRSSKLLSQVASA